MVSSNLSQKSETEKAVFKSFLRFYPKFAGTEIKSWNHIDEVRDKNSYNKPDIVCVDVTGKKLGVELTEWINEDHLATVMYWNQLVKSSIEITDWDIGLRIQKHPLESKTDQKILRQEIKSVLAQLISKHKQDKFFQLESGSAIQTMAPVLAKYCDWIYGYGPGTGEISAVPGLWGFPKIRIAKIENFWTQLMVPISFGDWEIRLLLADCRLDELESESDIVSKEMAKAINRGISKAKKEDGNEHASFVVSKQNMEATGDLTLAKYCYGIYGADSGPRKVELIPFPRAVTPQLCAMYALEEIIEKKLRKADYIDCMHHYQLDKLYLLVYQDYHLFKNTPFGDADMRPVAKNALQSFPLSIPFDGCYLYSVNYFTQKSGNKFSTSMQNALAGDLPDTISGPYFCDLVWSKSDSAC